MSNKRNHAEMEETCGLPNIWRNKSTEMTRLLNNSVRSQRTTFICVLSGNNERSDGKMCQAAGGHSVGDRRAVLGGSATELTKCDRPKAPLRRSSEGNYALRRKSSSSSNAADDPTSSDPSTSCTASSSSSSESGCNADSETCNYCRLSESSDSCECRDSTDGERSSSSEGNDTRKPRRLTRALSEDCYPPSKSRPVRRTSPGEYLRHKRHQMEKLRNERLNSPGRKSGITFQRCDSDPRLHLRKSKDHSPNRTLTFVSPTRNRIRQSHKPEQEVMVVSKVILPVSPTEPSEKTKPKRSALAKNVGERRTRIQERQPSIVWNAEDSTPFLECGGVMFRCAVCESDIPFTNCVLCNAETKGRFFNDAQDIAGPSEVTDEPPKSHNSNDDLVFSDDRNSEIERLAGSSQSSEEKKELEEFYDAPTPGNISPSVSKETSEEKKAQWSSKGAIHKSFNYDENYSSRRRNSQLRKYNSEPVPEKDSEESYIPSKSQADAPMSRHTSSDNSQSRAGSSSSVSSKSEKKSGYHIAKESPKRQTPEGESLSSCRTCDVTEDENSKEDSKERVLSPDVVVQDKNKRKSPNFLKPEFIFEPEIIHKANPLIDEAEVEVVPTAIGAFRRLSEDEFISTLNIHEAARKGDLHVVKLLTKKDPKQMETVDERGWTPIHLAAAHGHSEIVKYLAVEGAHLAALDPSSYTALHLAAMNGHKNCLDVLLPMGIDIDSVTAEGFTPLHLAVMK
ncbi:ankyrin repeat, PH and SEC7 domain containing protein secG [Trichonephila inaurata madagascariensis]|uniref:Alpha-latrotoxin n=1 Tax=Trichonephila inaurata madagascariensis TaxID=2747483 RepID=A0A8X6Y909_9ARAC|nr:ankyrin repeat, PH and SEC7 domain containing protein secG [Trichonephila inaurata madagascariensis]